MRGNKSRGLVNIETVQTTQKVIIFSNISKVNYISNKTGELRDALGAARSYSDSIGGGISSRIYCMCDF